MLEEIVAMERQVWQALVTGDAEVDAELLSPDFLGVYKSGFSDRDGHAAQLAQGPVVTAFDIKDARLINLSEGTVLLAYLARYTRPAAPDRQEAMYVSSIWQRTADGWCNIFSQDTDVAHPL